MDLNTRLLHGSVHKSQQRCCRRLLIWGCQRRCPMGSYMGWKEWQERQTTGASYHFCPGTGPSGSGLRMAHQLREQKPQATVGWPILSAPQSCTRVQPTRNLFTKGGGFRGPLPGTQMPKPKHWHKRVPRASSRVSDLGSSSRRRNSISQAKDGMADSWLPTGCHSGSFFLPACPSFSMPLFAKLCSGILSGHVPRHRRVEGEFFLFEAQAGGRWQTAMPEDHEECSGTPAP